MSSSTAQAVTVSYTIKPPPTLPAESHPAQPVTQTHPIPLVSHSSPPHPLSNTPVNTTTPHDSHYTSLLHSLSEAQKWMNESLTGWKDAVGDKEKHKEVVGTKRGEGKAAMMVKAAKEDGENKPLHGEAEAEESEEESDVEEGPDGQ